MFQISNKFNLTLLINISLVEGSLWRLIKNALHFNLQILIRGDKLERFANSDVILDLNGDIFPNDTGRFHVLKHALEIATIRQLGIPVIEYASSTGPFNTWFARAISKFMYNKISVFTNREPISSELLKQIGIKKPIVNTACPAFLLEPATGERAKEILVE